MISKVSFGSTYKVESKQNNWDSFKKFSDLADSKESESSNVVDIIKDKFSNSEYEVKRTLIVPDRMDDEIESYCAANGIKFVKHSTAELLDGQKIIERIADAPAKMKKVYVSVDKLESYLNNQESNIEHCKHDYKKFYTKDVNNMIKSGDKIPTTTLSIHGFGESADSVINYINKFGAKNLNENQLGFCFEQKTTEYPDQCMYFALKNMGMKHIPMYVDADGYKIGKALEIFD